MSVNRLPDACGNDWHAQRSSEEPRCFADQWRTRDRAEVLYISEMSDRHLSHCIRFAKTKPQHRSRLTYLIEEQSKREDAAGRRALGSQT